LPDGQEACLGQAGRADYCALSADETAKTKRIWPMRREDYFPMHNFMAKYARGLILPAAYRGGCEELHLTADVAE